jgi:replicative DNA helicase
LDSIPHNTEIERQVIGSALVDKYLPIDAKSLSTVDFYFNEHRKIWSAICELDEEGSSLDVIEISSRSGAKVSDLAKMSIDIPMHLDSRKAVSKLRELSTLRTLQKSFADLARRCMDGDVPELLEHVESLVKTTKNEQGKQAGSARLISEVYEQDVFPRLDKFVAGELVKIPFGFSRLDESTNGGASPGELVIFGAKPKSGKSAMLLQIAKYQADAGRLGVYICSREMLNYENAMRVLAQSTNYSMNSFRSGLYATTAEKLKEYARTYGNIPLCLDDKSKTVRDIRREIERLESEGIEIRSVFVDYVQLMRNVGRHNNKADALEEIIYDLKDLATDLEKVVYVNAQFNREGIDAEKPKMSDFKGSSAIEMAGNLILFWTIEQDVDVTLGGRRGEMWIEAGRNVPYDKFDICFYGEKALFSFLP